MWGLAVLILLAYLAFRYIYQPWRLFCWYRDTMRKLGYKVYQVKWNPIGGEIVKLSKSNLKQHGDVNYFWKHCQQYDVVLSNVMSQTLLILINPDLLSEFYAPDKVYIYQKYQRLNGLMTRFGGRGVIFDERDSWKRKRKTVNSVFTFEFIKGIVPILKSQIDDTFKAFEASKKFPRIHIYQDVFAKTLGFVTVKSFFGNSILEKKVEGENISTFWTNNVKNISIMSRSLDVFLFGDKVVDLGYRKIFRDLKRKNKVYNEQVIEFIRERVQEITDCKDANVGKKDVISQILRMNAKAECKESQYSEEDMVSQFNGLFLAGMETTSQLLTMMIYYMALNREVEEKVRAEIHKYVSSEDDVNFDNLKNFTYLECVQKETLRMYGPGIGTFVRESTQNHKLGDIPIWKNTLILTMTQTNNYNPKYFEDPHTFKPDRWLNDKEGDRHPFAYILFSAGPRSCIGKQFALMESKIFIIKFLRRYDFQLEKKDFKMMLGFGYVPEKIDTILTIREGVDVLTK